MPGGRHRRRPVHNDAVNQRDDRVLPATRALAWFIVPFLLVAFVVLFGYPDDTGRLFAWPIRPRMTPMVLGSVYLGGAYFFLRTATSKAWHRVQAGFVPVGTFATLMGVATGIHWDRFTHDHLAFWLWAGLYFTTPFLVFAAWAANRRRDPPATAADIRLSPVSRAAIGATAALSVATCTALFVAPGRMIPLWPWTLTPLTARVMGAIFSLGIGGFLVVADGRWSAAKVMFEVQGFMLVLFLGAGLASRNDIDFSKPLTRTLIPGLGITLLAGTALYLRMERQGHARTAGAGRFSRHGL